MKKSILFSATLALFLSGCLAALNPEFMLTTGGTDAGDTGDAGDGNIGTGDSSADGPGRTSGLDDGVDESGGEMSCGNGVVEGDEECDDGNREEDDSCSNNCEQSAECGNSVIEPELGEQCDDGNTDNNDLCDNSCRDVLCGDGNVTGDEQCDDPRNDECSDLCTLNGCGDGTLDIGEEDCDDGDLNGQPGFCPLGCSYFCGDGLLNEDGSEECDDGNDVNDDDCTDSCTIATCQDGVLQDGEECDDGNVVDNDGCTNSCNEVCQDLATVIGIEYEACRVALDDTDGCCEAAAACVTDLDACICVNDCIAAGIIPVFDCAPTCASNNAQITAEDADDASVAVNALLVCVNNEPACAGVEIVP